MVSSRDLSVQYEHAPQCGNCCCAVQDTWQKGDRTEITSKHQLRYSLSRDSLLIPAVYTTLKETETASDGSAASRHNEHLFLLQSTWMQGLWSARFFNTCMRTIQLLLLLLLLWL